MEGFKTITVPREIYNILKKQAEKTDKSMSQLVAEAIEKQIHQK